MNPSRFLRIIITTLFFTHQCVFLYAAQANFWSARRKALLPVLARLPGSPETLDTTRFNSPLRSRFDIRKEPFGERLPLLLKKLPLQYGSVRDVSTPSKGPADKTVLQIQDIHSNAEAQKNIGNTLRTLLEEGDVGLLALEGASGEINLGSFKTFPYQGSVRKVADYYFRKNFLSGAIHALFHASKPLPVILGIDDKDLYQANIDAFQTSQKTRKSVEAYLSLESQRLREEKRRLLNKRLVGFDEMVTRYRSGQMRLSSYVNELARIRAPGDRSQIKAFLTALKLESSLDLKRVKVEQERLMGRVAPALKPEERGQWRRMTLRAQTEESRPSDFYRYLNAVCRRAGISLNDFPAVQAYVRYVQVVDELNPADLLMEVRTVEKKIYKHLVRSAAGETLILRSKRLHWLEKLTDFSLTKAEWLELKTTGFLSSGLEKSGQPGFFHPFRLFYELAESRDLAMTRNLLRAMKKTQGPFPSPRPLSVLVTGGFHADGIRENLLKEGYNVISFVPRISHVKTTRGYVSLTPFTREKSPLDILFKGEKLFLAPPPIESSMLHGIFPALISLHAKFMHPMARLKKMYQTLGGSHPPLTMKRIVKRTVYAVLQGKNRAVSVVMRVGGGGNIEKIESTAGPELKRSVSALLRRPLQQEQIQRPVDMEEVQASFLSGDVGKIRSVLIRLSATDISDPIYELLIDRYLRGVNQHIHYLLREFFRAHYEDDRLFEKLFELIQVTDRPEGENETKLIKLLSELVVMRRGRVPRGEEVAGVIGEFIGHDVRRGRQPTRNHVDLYEALSFFPNESSTREALEAVKSGVKDRLDAETHHSRDQAMDVQAIRAFGGPGEEALADILSKRADPIKILEKNYSGIPLTYYHGTRLGLIATAIFSKGGMFGDPLYGLTVTGSQSLARSWAQTEADGVYAGDDNFFSTLDYNAIKKLMSPEVLTMIKTHQIEDIQTVVEFTALLPGYSSSQETMGEIPISTLDLNALTPSSKKDLAGQLKNVLTEPVDWMDDDWKRAIDHVQGRNLFAPVNPGRVQIMEYSHGFMSALTRLSPRDRDLFDVIISGESAAQRQVMKKNPKKVYLAHHDVHSGSENGRTIYLQLDQPIRQAGRIIRILRFKGVRPRKNGYGQVAAHRGFGHGRFSYDVDRDGALLIRAGIFTPLGAMGAGEGRLEYAAASQNKYLDLAILWGKYPGAKFHGRPTEFVVTGLEEPDQRLDFKEARTRGRKRSGDERTLALHDLSSGHRSVIDDLTVQGHLTEQIGITLRRIHDRGLYHQGLIPMNIGVVGRRSSEFKIIFRDFEDSQFQVDQKGAIMSAPEEQVYRLLDLQRILHDLHVLAHRSKDDGKDQVDPWEGMVESFLKGYFFDLKGSSDFNSLIESVKSPVFYDSLNQIFYLSKIDAVLPFDQLQDRFGPLVSFLQRTIRPPRLRWRMHLGKVLAAGAWMGLVILVLGGWTGGWGPELVLAMAVPVGVGSLNATEGDEEGSNDPDEAVLYRLVKRIFHEDTRVIDRLLTTPAANWMTHFYEDVLNREPVEYSVLNQARAYARKIVWARRSPYTRRALYPSLLGLTGLGGTIKTSRVKTYARWLSEDEELRNLGVTPEVVFGDDFRTDRVPLAQAPAAIRKEFGAIHERWNQANRIREEQPQRARELDRQIGPLYARFTEKIRRLGFRPYDLRTGNVSNDLEDLFDLEWIKNFIQALKGDTPAGHSDGAKLARFHSIGDSKTRQKHRVALDSGGRIQYLFGLNFGIWAEIEERRGKPVFVFYRKRGKTKERIYSPEVTRKTEFLERGIRVQSLPSEGGGDKRLRILFGNKSTFQEDSYLDLSLSADKESLTLHVDSDHLRKGQFPDAVELKRGGIAAPVWVRRHFDPAKIYLFESPVLAMVQKAGKGGAKSPRLFDDLIALTANFWVRLHRVLKRARDEEFGRQISLEELKRERIMRYLMSEDQRLWERQGEARLHFTTHSRADALFRLWAYNLLTDPEFRKTIKDHFDIVPELLNGHLNQIVHNLILKKIRAQKGELRQYLPRQDGMIPTAVGDVLLKFHDPPIEGGRYELTPEMQDFFEKNVQPVAGDVFLPTSILDLSSLGEVSFHSGSGKTRPIRLGKVLVQSNGITLGDYLRRLDQEIQFALYLRKKEKARYDTRIAREILTKAFLQDIQLAEMGLTNRRPQNNLKQKIIFPVHGLPAPVHASLSSLFPKKVDLQDLKAAYQQVKDDIPLRFRQHYENLIDEGFHRLEETIKSPGKATPSSQRVAPVVDADITTALLSDLQKTVMKVKFSRLKKMYFDPFLQTSPAAASLRAKLLGWTYLVKEIIPYAGSDARAALNEIYAGLHESKAKTFTALRDLLESLWSRVREDYAGLGEAGSLDDHVYRSYYDSTLKMLTESSVESRREREKIIQANAMSWMGPGMVVLAVTSLAFFLVRANIESAFLRNSFSALTVIVFLWGGVPLLVLGGALYAVQFTRYQRAMRLISLWRAFTHPLRRDGLIDQHLNLPGVLKKELGRKLELQDSFGQSVVSLFSVLPVVSWWAQRRLRTRWRDLRREIDLRRPEEVSTQQWARAIGDVSETFVKKTVTRMILFNSNDQEVFYIVDPRDHTRLIRSDFIRPDQLGAVLREGKEFLNNGFMDEAIVRLERVLHESARLAELGIFPQEKAKKLQDQILKRTVVMGLSGGDAPGINPAMSEAARVLFKERVLLAGVGKGFEGLGVDALRFPRQLGFVRRRNLRSARYWSTFEYGSSREKFSRVRENALKNIERTRGVIFVGGDDHANEAAKMAAALSEKAKQEGKALTPVAVIGKSIDNDITGKILGPETVVDLSRELYWGLGATARAHGAMSWAEIMGRDAGWLAYLTGNPSPHDIDTIPEGTRHNIERAQAGSLTLIPEVPAYLEEVLVAALERFRKTGYFNGLVGEGFSLLDMNEEHRRKKNTLFYRLIKMDEETRGKFRKPANLDVHGNPRLAGIGTYLTLALVYSERLAAEGKELKEFYGKLNRDEKAKLRDAFSKLVVEKTAWVEETLRQIPGKQRDRMDQIFNGLSMSEKMKLSAVLESAVRLKESSLRESMEYLSENNRLVVRAMLDNFTPRQREALDRAVQALSEKSKKALGSARFTNFGYIFRGLPPRKKDRVLGRRYGRRAARLILRSKTGLMVVMGKFENPLDKRSKVRAVPVGQVAKKEKVTDRFSIEELKQAGVLIPNSYRPSPVSGEKATKREPQGWTPLVGVLFAWGWRAADSHLFVGIVPLVIGLVYVSYKYLLLKGQGGPRLTSEDLKAVRAGLERRGFQLIIVPDEQWDRRRMGSPYAVLVGREIWMKESLARNGRSLGMLLAHETGEFRLRRAPGVLRETLANLLEAVSFMPTYLNLKKTISKSRGSLWFPSPHRLGVGQLDPALWKGGVPVHPELSPKASRAFQPRRISLEERLDRPRLSLRSA